MATDSSTSIQIKGLKETIRSMEQFGVSAEDLKTAFGKIGLIIQGDAQSNVRSKTGALAASIRPSKTKNKSVIRAGSAKVPYAGVQEYGGYHGIEPMSFLRNAIDSNRDTASKLIDDELGDLIAQYDLK